MDASLEWIDGEAINIIFGICIDMRLILIYQIIFYNVNYYASKKFHRLTHKTDSQIIILSYEN